jgi:hypothetical protein
MFIVYLAVNSFLLFLDTMQKLLNTNKLAAAHLKQVLSSRGWMLASFILVFIGLATSAQAATFGNNYVIIGGSNTAGNGTYYTNSNNSSSPNKPGATSFRTIGNLGSYDRGTGSLRLSGESHVTNENGGGNAAVSVSLFYRVYPAGTPSNTIPDYTEIHLTKSPNTIGNGANATSVWTTPGTLELINGIPSASDYTLDLYYELKTTRAQFQDNINYTVGFNVSGSVPATWNGSRGNSWFDPMNWTPNGIPGPTTDVTISYVPNARQTYYPKIETGATAEVRTLRLQGNNGGIGARTFVSAGELKIYGDFLDPNAGFNQTGGIFTLAGINKDQTFDGASFFDVRIQGGGKKTLTNQMDVSSSLTFTNGGGVLVTSTANALSYNVTIGVGAQILGESENSYVLGIVYVPFRAVYRGRKETFGNIGVELTASPNAPNDPGTTLAVRTTGITYNGVSTKDVSVKRSFTFTPDNPDNLNSTLVFRYLDVELNGLTPSKLELARSITGAGPFESLGRSNNSANTVTSTVIPGTLAATFTLGETVAPLPVTLVSFTATTTPQGAALLRWVTAKELNNKGFGIERSLGTTDTWKEVGYLATTNTPNGKSYEYTDKSLITAPASTQAYYRLRQEDLDGKVTYSPVAAVARQAALASTGIVLSPVPLDGPNLSVSFAEAGQAGQEVAIINTQGQRMLHFTTQNSAEGTLSLPVANLAAGVYIVRIQTPGQAVRHARFVKL